MTVAELIAALKALKSPNARVYVRGYEAGVNDVDNLVGVKVERDHYTDWYYGQHREAYDDEDGEPGIEICGSNKLVKRD